MDILLLILGVVGAVAATGLLIEWVLRTLLGAEER